MKQPQAFSYQQQVTSVARPIAEDRKLKTYRDEIHENSNIDRFVRIV